MNRKLLMAYMTIIQIVLIVLMAAPALATDRQCQQRHRVRTGILTATATR